MLFTNINLWLLLSKHVSRALLIRLHILSTRKRPISTALDTEISFPSSFLFRRHRFVLFEVSEDNIDRLRISSATFADGVCNAVVDILQRWCAANLASYDVEEA